MRLLIVIAVAALTAIVVSYVLKQLNGSWAEDSTIRTAVGGAVVGLVSMTVSRSLKKD